jgi:hypothetical protein
MWKTVYDSVRGTSHIDADLPCQDACRVVELEVENGTMLVVCSSDGAGSAAHSAEGAEIACDTFIRIARRELNCADLCKYVDRSTVLGWCDEIRLQIESRATELSVETRQLATTFLVAIVGESSALFFQIGDGAIVTWEGDAYRAVFWPQSGEFANTTNFLTDEDFGEHVECICCERGTGELAVFTDGLERLVLRFADRSVHEPFLAGMFATLRNVDDTEPYFEFLRQFLNSPKVNERTDDDKTLILATRMKQSSSDDAVP